MDDGLELYRSMEPSPTLGDMRSERARAQTFQNCWPADTGRKLASCGYYCIQSGRCVRCAFCGLEILMVSDSAEDVRVKHWKSAKTYCPFLRGEDVGNVTDDTECVTNTNVSGRRSPRTEHSRLVSATPVNLPPTTLHSNHSFTFLNAIPTSHPELTSPSRHNLPPTSPARHTSSQQPWPRQRDSHPRHPSPSFNTHHRTASPTTTTTTTHLPANIIVVPDQPMTWADIVRTARYPQMASYQARLDTLSTWPLVKPTPEELARAGLFHVNCRSSNRSCPPSDLEIGGPDGRGTAFPGGRISQPPAASSGRQCVDSVKCFWCGERLHRWQKTDDALLEHARLSPTCRYVTQLVGQHLHSDVVNAAAAMPETGELKANV